MLNTIVFNLTTFILCRTLFIYITIVSGVNIKTSLLTDYQVVTFCIPAEVRTILKISITEYTVGALAEFIVVLPPIWVIELGRTEQYLTCRVVWYMDRSALQIVLRRSRINHVHNTAVGTWSRCNLGRAVVCRETSLPLLVDFKVNSTTSCGTHHTCRRNDTCLISVTDTERISQVSILLGNTQV